MTNKIWLFGCCASSLCGLLACAGGKEGDGNAPETDPTDEVREAGLHWESGALVFRTEPFTVPPGEEQYLCWALTTEEALKINALRFDGASVVHHFLFAKTAAPEPEGFSTCETLFKPTWLPLFSAGAGANELKLPPGVAHDLAPGTQLLVQLHLLNSTTKEITDATEITMDVTDEPDTQAVQIGGFGSFKISLPPLQASTVTHECTLPESSRVVAMMPHMHRMGTSMTLELGKSANDLQVFYSRELWDFDQQTIDNFDQNVEGGQYARITCSYDNKTDRTITYGESTLDEMCFLGAFWVGTPMNCVAF